MSGSMARQGSQVQLEQSDMHITMNLAKMAKAGVSPTAKEGAEYLIMNPRVEVQIQ